MVLYKSGDEKVERSLALNFLSFNKSQQTWDAQKRVL